MTETRLPEAPELHRSPETPDRTLEWRVHLARTQPGKAAGAALAMLAAGLVVGLVFQNPLLALGTVAAVVGSIAEFLFPISHRLTAEGAEVRYGLSRWVIAWSQVRKCYLRPDGVKLSPLVIPGRLESFRGVFLRFADNREQVLEFIQQARHAAGHGIHA